MEEGQEVLLRQGDCVVQRGTNHAWVNKSGRRPVAKKDLHAPRGSVCHHSASNRPCRKAMKDCTFCGTRRGEG